MYNRVLKMGDLEDSINPERHRFPHCLVWTPIPVITWILPFIGHMGITTSSGVIRDFAGSYFVSEDDMGFGWPTRFIQLDLRKVEGGPYVWDKAVEQASNEYTKRTHNLICDNCHSHVAMALDNMEYAGKRGYNMVGLTALMLFKGRFVGICAFLQQWLPFLIFVAIIVAISVGANHII